MEGRKGYINVNSDGPEWWETVPQVGLPNGTTLDPGGYSKSVSISLVLLQHASWD